MAVAVGTWRIQAAVAPTGLLAWEPPCAAGVALKSKKKKKKVEWINHGILVQ